MKTLNLTKKGCLSLILALVFSFTLLLSPHTQAIEMKAGSSDPKVDETHGLRVKGGGKTEIDGSVTPGEALPVVAAGSGTIANAQYRIRQQTHSSVETKGIWEAKMRAQQAEIDALKCKRGFNWHGLASVLFAAGAVGATIYGTYASYDLAKRKIALAEDTMMTAFQKRHGSFPVGAVFNSLNGMGGGGMLGLGLMGLYGGAGMGGFGLNGGININGGFGMGGAMGGGMPMGMYPRVGAGAGAGAGFHLNAGVNMGAGAGMGMPGYTMVPTGTVGMVPMGGGSYMMPQQMGYTGYTGYPNMGYGGGQQCYECQWNCRPLGTGTGYGSYGSPSVPVMSRRRF